VTHQGDKESCANQSRDGAGACAIGGGRGCRFVLEYDTYHLFQHLVDVKGNSVFAPERGAGTDHGGVREPLGDVSAPAREPTGVERALANPLDLPVLLEKVQICARGSSSVEVVRGVQEGHERYKCT
jgi:hypothetical protein